MKYSNFLLRSSPSQQWLTFMFFSYQWEAKKWSRICTFLAPVQRVGFTLMIMFYKNKINNTKSLQSYLIQRKIQREQPKKEISSLISYLIAYSIL